MFDWDEGSGSLDLDEPSSNELVTTQEYRFCLHTYYLEYTTIIMITIFFHHNL